MAAPTAVGGAAVFLITKISQGPAHDVLILNASDDSGSNDSGQEELRAERSSI